MPLKYFYIGGPGIATGQYGFCRYIVTIPYFRLGRFHELAKTMNCAVNSGLLMVLGAGLTQKNRGEKLYYFQPLPKLKTTQQAIDLALKTYARLWKKVLDAETLNQQKPYVKGQFPPRYETQVNLAYSISRYVYL